jgi:hypothetical protein
MTVGDFGWIAALTSTGMSTTVNGVQKTLPLLTGWPSVILNASVVASKGLSLMRPNACSERVGHSCVGQDPMKPEMHPDPLALASTVI